MKKQISIIIPAFNEEKSIGKLLEDIDKLLIEDCEVIVVDDGSTDDIVRIVEKYDFVKLIKHPYNKGYGAALKTGISRSQGDTIILIDADNQHDPSDIRTLLSYIGEFDLVIGSRTEKYGAIWRRRIGNFILNKIGGYLVDMKIPDLNSGLRAFKKEKILNLIHLYPNGYSFSTTCTLSFISAGHNVKFVPIKEHIRCEGSKSNIKLFHDGLKFLILIFRVIVLFNPLKIFLPISIVLFWGGVFYAIWSIYSIMHIAAGAIVAIVSSSIIFFFGLIADQISCMRRENN